MASKAQRRRNKRRANDHTDVPEVSGGQVLQLRAVAKRKSNKPTPERQSNKPTPERQSRGVWVKGKEYQPDVDRASDMAGVLYHKREINQAQLEAARAFQEVRAAYVAEIGTFGYKSCLAGGFGGHDESDGNPEVFKAYRHFTRPLAKQQLRALEVGLDMSPDEAGRLIVWKIRNALKALVA